MRVYIKQRTNKNKNKKTTTMGRGAHSKAVRKVHKDFARGKVAVGNSHSSRESSSTHTRKGYRNTRRINLKHRESVTNKMMVYGTPTVKGVEQMVKTSGNQMKMMTERIITIL